MSERATREAKAKQDEDQRRALEEAQRRRVEEESAAQAEIEARRQAEADAIAAEERRQAIARGEPVPNRKPADPAPADAQPPQRPRQ